MYETPLCEENGSELFATAKNSSDPFFDPKTLKSGFSLSHSVQLLIGILLCSHQHGTEYLVSQQERVISDDDLPGADRIQPDDWDSLKFFLPKESVEVRRKPLAAEGLYAYEPVGRWWNCGELTSRGCEEASLRSSADDVQPWPRIDHDMRVSESQNC